MLLPKRCAACRRPGRSPCLACISALTPPPTGAVPALFAYTGAGRQLLTALKYRNGRSALPWLGRALAALVAPGSIEVVTWAPTHTERRRRRGYDQAELLATAVAGALGVPCRALLRRTDRAGPQTGHSRAERLGAPAFAARACRQHVLLVDDVVTTGATLLAASAALRAAGAPSVVAVAAAATPPPRARPRSGDETPRHPSYARRSSSKGSPAWTSS